MGNSPSSSSSTHSDDGVLGSLGSVPLRRHREITEELKRQNHWLRQSLQRVQNDFEKRSTETFNLAVAGAIGCTILFVGVTGGMGYTIAKRNATIKQLRSTASALQDKVARTERVLQSDLEASKRFGASKLAKDLLEVHDDLSRAVYHQPKLTDDMDESVRNYIEGIPFVQQRLVSVLNKHSITEIPALGQQLDPNLHEACSLIPLPTDGEPGDPRGIDGESSEQQTDSSTDGDGNIVSHQRNEIASVLSPGFMLHDRVLRPSRVAVYA